MINTMSPTIASMLQNVPSNSNGNMAFFGNNGVQAVPAQPAYPSPKEMLINGYNSPIMQGYYNPYMGYNNNYNGYGINPGFYAGAQGGFYLTQEDMNDPYVKATYNSAIQNHITFEQQENMQTRILKQMMRCVASFLNKSDEEREAMEKACDPKPKPSEIRRMQLNKRATDIGKPMRPTKIQIYRGDDLISETDPSKCAIQDFRTIYCVGDKIDQARIDEYTRIENNKYIAARLYETAPEREADKAKNLVDFFNNYGYKIEKSYQEYHARQSKIKQVSQLYSREEFLKLMKMNNVLGYRDIDMPEAQNLSGEFKESAGYQMVTAFNRNPTLAGSAIYNPDDNSVTITAPKWIRDKYDRFSGSTNSIASEYQQRKQRFLSSIGGS